MIFRLITIFPGFFDSCLGEGLLGKAAAKGLVEVQVDDLRRYATGKHKTVDDAPYGGGPGMVMKVDVWARAIAAARRAVPGARVILLTPQGELLNEQTAVRLAREPGLVFCCGRYEGVDERVAERLADEGLSIGDYVLTGGEAAALVALDAVARKLPGVVGKTESVSTDSFVAGLKYPQYTRPARYRSWVVPEVLLSGDHRRIEQWRREEALRRTARLRPVLAARTAAHKVRLMLLEPDPLQLSLVAGAVAGYGLRELAACIADPGSRRWLAEVSTVKAKTYAGFSRARSRWRDELVIHLADQAGPGQVLVAQVARLMVAAPAGVTLTWGGMPPEKAVLAAPVLRSQPAELAALFAWLERLFGGA